MAWTTSKIPGDTILSADWNAMAIDQQNRLLKDGTIELTADWDIGAGNSILAEAIKARSNLGLNLLEDGGLGIFIQDTSAYVGMKNLTPRRPLDVLDTVDAQLRLTYSDNINYADFKVDSSGYLEIEPSGGRVTIVGVMSFPNTGLRVHDTNDSHDLILTPNSDLTANRTLYFTTGDATRDITLTGDPTLDDWFDQSVKTTALPTFDSLTLSDSLFLTPLGAAPGAPSEGQLYANSVTNKAYYYNGSSWISIVEAGAGGGDIITEGDSSVEVVDAGTGQIEFVVDATNVGYMTVSGLGLGTATPNNLLEVLDAASPAIRVAYDASYYTELQALSAGEFCILPSGESIYLYATSVSNDGSFILANVVTKVSGNWRGFRDETAFTGSGGAQAYAAFDAEASLESTYDYDHIVGFQSRVKHSSSGSLTSLAAFSSTLQTTGGTVTDAWGLKVWNPSGGGSITNNYGVYINDLTSGTNNFGLYSAGTAVKHYIGGKLGIGTTTQNALLTVSGVYSSGRGQIQIIGTSADNSYMTFYYNTLLCGSVGWITGNMILENFNNNVGGNLIFKTKAAAAETARFDVNGHFGIGTTSPDKILEVLDASDVQLRLTQSDSSIYTDFQTDANGYMEITPTGLAIVLPDPGVNETYINFDGVGGTGGIGIRNNGGQMEYKNDAGSWTAIGSGGAAGSSIADGDTSVLCTDPTDVTVDVNGASVAVFGATTQLSLIHTAGSKYVNFTVDTNHDMTIQPTSTGQIILKPTTDSVDFVEVKNAAGTGFFFIDSTNEIFQLKTGAVSNKWLYCNDADGTVSWESLPTGGAPQYSLGQLASGDATPDISSATSWLTHTTGVTITALDGSYAEGDIRIIIFTDVDTIIQNNASINLSGGQNFTGGVDDTLTLIYIGSSKWVEVCRSINS